MISTKFQMPFWPGAFKCSPDLMEFFTVALPFTLFLCVSVWNNWRSSAFWQVLTAQHAGQEAWSGWGALFREQAPLLCVLIISSHFSSSVFSGFCAPKRRILAVAGKLSLTFNGTASPAGGHYVWAFSVIPAALGDGPSSLTHSGAECVVRIFSLSC